MEPTPDPKSNLNIPAVPQSTPLPGTSNPVDFTPKPKRNMKILAITLFLAVAIPISVLVALQIQDIRQKAAVNTIGSDYPDPAHPANRYGWNGTCYTNLNVSGSSYQGCTVNLWKCPGLTSIPPNGCQQNVQAGVKCFDNNFCGVQQLDVDCSNVLNFCVDPPYTQPSCTNRRNYDSFRSTVRTTPDCGVSNPTPTPTPVACVCTQGHDNWCSFGPPACRPYCDPNGDNNYSDADWSRGYYEYQSECSTTPSPTPPPTCPSDINAQFRINYNPPCPVTGGNSNCDKGWNTNHNATLGNLPSVGVEVLQFNIFNNTGQSHTDGVWVLRDRFGNAVLSGRHSSTFDPRNVPTPYVTGGPYHLEFTSDITHNVCGTGQITLDPPPPTPTPVPTRSPTPTPSPFAQCQNIKVYRVGTIGNASSWTLLNSTDLPNLQPGETVYIATVGTVANGVIDKARIRVNSTVWTALNETTQVKPKANLTEPDEFYVAYTVPTGVITFSFQSELHEINGNRWY